jgi:hypothetical protein
MALEDVHKFILMTKSGFFYYIIMSFGMKNATHMYSKTMTEVFGAYMDKFLKIFVGDLNVHSLIGEEHIEYLQYMCLCG